MQLGRMSWAFGVWVGKARQGKGGTLDEGCEAVRISVQKHSIDELVEWISSLPMKSEVPTNFSYSNSGYILLGKIIETVSGSTYADFLEREIFGPAVMKDFALESSSILSYRASGYEMTAEGQQPYRYGWNRASIRANRTMAFHHGGINGYTASYLKLLDQEIAVIVLSNVSTMLTSTLAGVIVNALGENSLL
ncbi:serine hydrolase domain-containing protein [Paenibacillus glucanolyticus]|uniref:serine hydrolase domain-containing protein n=1 Tax=Paenibacillus glucanolyticus TaxID=59843 RepID=UPI00097B92FD|nr:serine hydrolase domain-containing protein [Paenibacillus glucanolyticus]OMF72091.1 hypothetical protein BK142_21650 [Paenibacillus glucanolyticus]